MNYVRRVALLRFTALVAIAVSAVLTVDHIRPGRDFCPFAEACAAAANSALGSVGGVPTSVIGMGAFGLLLLLTLLPLEWARPMLKPAGAFAALAGLGFIAYQRLALDSYCPLCLIADGAGFVAGVLTVTWPRLPMRRSGRHIHWEGGSSRLAWTMAGCLAAVVPFAIPRPEDPGWVEITPLTAEAFDEPAPAVVAEVPPVVAPAPETPETGSEPDLVAAPTPTPTLPASTGATPTTTAIVTDTPVPEAESAAPAPATAVVAATPARPPVPTRTRPPPAREQPAREQPAPLLVEYLNAFCAHCRATHQRLRSVLDETGVEVRFRRVYTWNDRSAPEWARACAYASAFGLEDRMFEELLVARRPSRSEVLAAAERAGVDTTGLRACLDSNEIAPRLVRDRRLVQSAGLRKLPTIDIGRRRLMGAQSSDELRGALLAAATPE